MSLVLLDAPEAAQINVVGNMYNCRFQGMNLYANDVTSINVGQTAKQNMENSGLLNPNTDGPASRWVVTSSTGVISPPLPLI
jgi:hypothetical protein